VASFGEVEGFTGHGILYDGLEVVDDRGDGEDAARFLVQAGRPWLTSSIGRHR
jgi:hypothetical protein